MLLVLILASLHSRCAPPETLVFTPFYPLWGAVFTPFVGINHQKNHEKPYKKRTRVTHFLPKITTKTLRYDRENRLFQLKIRHTPPLRKTITGWFLPSEDGMGGSWRICKLIELKKILTSLHTTTTRNKATSTLIQGGGFELGYVVKGIPDVGTGLFAWEYLTAVGA